MLNVSIVTYHTPAEELQRCLDSLLISSFIHHVYIVDNGEEERLKFFCAQQDDKRIIYIAHPNTGYGAGHNVALRKSMAEDNVKYHLVINSDVYYDKGNLELVMEYMENHPNVGQVIPKVIYPDGRLQYACRLLPSPMDLFIRRFLPKSWCDHRRQIYTLALTRYDHEMNVPYHTGCFMFLRVEALRETGLFDERFFLYPEDIDLTRRIHRHWQTMFFPGATIVHDHHAASYKSFSMLWVHFVNMCRYFNKWGWVFDSERKMMNERLLKQENLIGGERR